jgi:predicted permease
VLDVFLDVVLPVIIVAILGGAVGRWRGIPIPPLSGLVFYLFGPALVFNSMSKTELSAELGLKILAVMVVTLGVMFIAASVWSTSRRHDAGLRAGFALAATSPNVGNMGLPVAALAFGDLGLQVAVVNFVAGAVLVNSAGIAIASMAERRDAWSALLTPFKYPYLYAAGLGILVNALSVDLPTAIEAPVASMAGATIPIMLVVLGLQLRNVVEHEDLVDTVAVNIGRLLIAPIAAWGTATALGLEGVERGTLVILAAMPVAVITTILATEFKARPDFVTRVVITSTLASILTLTVLIDLVR